MPSFHPFSRQQRARGGSCAPSTEVRVRSHQLVRLAAFLACALASGCSTSVRDQIVADGGTASLLSLEGPPEQRTAIQAPPILSVEAIARADFPIERTAAERALTEVALQAGGAGAMVEALEHAASPSMPGGSAAAEARDEGGPKRLGKTARRLEDAANFLRGVAELVGSFRPKKITSHTFTAKVDGQPWTAFCAANFDGLEDEEGRWYTRQMHCELWNSEESWQLTTSRATLGTFEASLSRPGESMRVERHSFVGAPAGYTVWDGTQALAHTSFAFDLVVARARDPRSPAALVAIAAIVAAPQARPRAD